MNKWTWAGALTLSLLAQPGLAQSQCSNLSKHIVDTDLRFSLTHSQIPGELAVSSHKLRVSGKHYKLESVSQAKGFIALLYSGQLTQKSEGVVERHGGLAPIYYAEQRGKKPLAETVVDAQTKTVLFKRNGESAPAEEGLQDRLSMIYHLSSLLRCNGEANIGDTLDLRVMSTGRLGTETFTAKTRDAVTLSLGEGARMVKTVMYESTPKDANDEVVRIWFGKDMNWQPVKIQIQDPDGKSLTQTLIGEGKLPEQS
jgi:hypothetical protein